MDFKVLFNCVLTFILSIYANSQYPRKLIQEILDFMYDFICNFFLPSLKADIIADLKKNNDSNTTLKNVEKCFQKHSTIFDNIRTESKRFQILQSKGFIQHEEYVIGKCFIEKLVENGPKLVADFTLGIHVPLRKIPNVLQQIMEHMEKLKNEKHIISNVIQADLWLKKYSLKVLNEIILPLYIYYDELEVGNALGSHAGINKFGVVYAMIACLPPQLTSRLTNIIFTNLFHSEDKSNSDNKSVFGEIIKEINFLQREGISVTTNNGTYKIKFQLMVVLGDNLGLNGMFGFVESFKARYWCRICRCSSEETSKLTTEDESKLRTVENYNKDLTNKDCNFGIKESCVFNDVDNFHILENISVDFMHDILEGVCIYVMRSIIYAFIFEKKYFTLEILNNKIQNIQYNHLEISNKPPVIFFNRVKNKLNLKFSAAEMLCLVRYFGLMVGDLIPENDEYWILYKHLWQIIDIMIAPKFIKDDMKILENLIQKHNALYIHLFGRLKPKFHLLSHYPKILLKNGLCINFQCMRLESRHREVKANAKSSSCKKNLLTTIATKQLLKMCYTFQTLSCNNINSDEILMIFPILRLVSQ